MDELHDYYTVGVEEVYNEDINVAAMSIAEFMWEKLPSWAQAMQKALDTVEQDNEIRSLIDYDDGIPF